MNLNHDNVSSSAPVTETSTAIGVWQLTKGGFGLGLGWAIAETTVGLITGGITAIGAGATALAACFAGGDNKKEEPKK